MTDWEAIGATCGLKLERSSARSVAGGSISSAWRVESDRGPLFLKLEPAAAAERLAAEADGLAALAEVGEIRIPKVWAQGVVNSQAYLVMEWIESGGKGSPALLGEQLAAMHRHSGPHFGWSRDSFIGSTPQPNPPTSDWPAFVRDHRIGFQLELATSAGHRFDPAQSQHLLDGIGQLYTDYQPRPSLLHGDLWGGNWFTDTDGRPVIFDPAVYYGDREADLAMTELFGGFGPDFYAAYERAWPLDPGYAVRRDLHQLYHVLNHLNLFGGGYFGQARTLFARLCAALG